SGERFVCYLTTFSMLTWVQAESPQFLQHRRARNAEPASGLTLVTGGAVDRLRVELTIRHICDRLEHIFQLAALRAGQETADVFREALIDRWSRGYHLGECSCDHLRTNDKPTSEQQRFANNIAQLANITGPRMLFEQPHC